MESFSSVSGLNFEETELSLSLPGESRSVNSSGGRKRGFQESRVDLTLGSSSKSDDCYSRTSNGQPDNGISDPAKPPAKKAQVVGWPPVKSTRKNMMKSSSKFVKVAVDGAPYLRKVDLEMYGSYEQLLTGLENMFSCLGICNIVKEKKLLDPANGMEYVPTYEDKDGDWMLVGDVPWKMFVESCKRIRLMKGSATDQEISRASPNCSSTNT